MWKIKTWKLSEKEDYLTWYSNHQHTHEITHLFINNGYGVEYRPWRLAYKF